MPIMLFKLPYYSHIMLKHTMYLIFYCPAITETEDYCWWLKEFFKYENTLFEATDDG